MYNEPPELALSFTITRMGEILSSITILVEIYLVRKTLASVLRAARWTEDDLRRLGLL